MKGLLSFIILFFFATSASQASVPVPYAGKVSIDGKNFHGQLKFMFAIYTASNDMVWDSGSDPIELPVSNGRYLVLLGGQGMRPLPASLFHEKPRMRIIIPISSKRAMLECMIPIPGAFSICMGMCGNGLRIGIVRLIRSVTLWSIQRVQVRARFG